MDMGDYCSFSLYSYIQFKNGWLKRCNLAKYDVLINMVGFRDIPAFINA